MGGSRDILNCGVHIGGRIVTSFDEIAPADPNDGLPVTAKLDSNIAITSPFILCMTEIVNGINPLVDLHVYAYFHLATQLTSKWQRIRTATVTGDITNFVTFPTLGAYRFQVIVPHADGSPDSVRLYYRGVSKEAVDLIHTYEGEYRPIVGSGNAISITTSVATRIGPLTLDRAYQYFSDQICRVAPGNSSVVATANDPPIQAGPIYEHRPRRASEQYISFLADNTDGNLWYGQFT